jgi:hypothetical protein
MGSAALKCPNVAAFRRRDRSKNSPACFVVRGHNGQQLAYV